MGRKSAILNKGIRGGRQQNNKPSAEVKMNKVPRKEPLAREGPLPTKRNRSPSPITAVHASGTLDEVVGRRSSAAATSVSLAAMGGSSSASAGGGWCRGHGWCVTVFMVFFQAMQ